MFALAAFAPGCALHCCPVASFTPALPPLCRARAAGGRPARRPRPAAMAAALPTAEELQTAGFLECVRHAEVLLGFRETALPTENAALLAAMVKTSDGARGFFVSLLSQPDVLLADQTPLPDTLLAVLRGSVEDRLVADLIVKNAVMSTAMAVQYEGEGKSGMAAGSALTSRRSSVILRATYTMPGSAVPQIMEMMLAALDGSAGGNLSDAEKAAYVPFVKKWGYNDKQKQQCAALLRASTSTKAA